MPSARDQTGRPPLLEVRVIAGGGGPAVLEASGELDLSTVTELREPLLDRIGEGMPIVLDLTEVSFIDSSGIAVMLEALRSAPGAPAGLNTVVAPESQVARVLAVAGVDRALKIFAGRDEALRALRGGQGTPG